MSVHSVCVDLVLQHFLGIHHNLSSSPVSQNTSGRVFKPTAEVVSVTCLLKTLGLLSCEGEVEGPFTCLPIVSLSVRAMINGILYMRIITVHL